MRVRFIRISQVFILFTALAFISPLLILTESIIQENKREKPEQSAREERIISSLNKLDLR